MSNDRLAFILYEEDQD